MLIRKLTKEERYDASLISTYCFHGRVDDESLKLRKEGYANGPESTSEDVWGAFDEDGTLMAGIINNKFQFYLDGNLIPGGGIGGVSTWPEYRNSGAVKYMFAEILRDAYESGEVISALSPFNQEFYRKRGYEIINFQSNYTLSPALLTGYRFNGKVTRWVPGTPVDDYLKVFSVYAEQFNLAMPRTQEKMLEHMKVKNLFQDRKFSYLLTQDGEPVAYVVFSDVKGDDGAILHAEECAWTCRDGFWGILGFLGRFTADYKKIELPLPYGIDLMRLIRTPRAYEATKTCRFDYMVRVINAPKLLETIKKPVDCDFTIQVSDEDLPENNGTWRVTADGVAPCGPETPVDISMNERALAQMAVGSVNFDEALLRQDVELLNEDKEELLRRVFVEKKIIMTQFF